MTVKELIEKLQSLDPERQIWVYYDLYELQEPEFETWEEEGRGEMKTGDYVHLAY